jgi:hypothetical protein
LLKQDQARHAKKITERNFFETKIRRLSESKNTKEKKMNKKGSQT